MLLGVLVLSGCLRSEVRFDLQSPERTDVSFLIAIDLEVFGEILEGFGAADEIEELESLSGQELISEIGEGEDPCTEVVGGVTFAVEEYREGSLRGVRCTARDVAVAEVFGGFFDDPQALRVEDTTGRWVLEGRVAEALGVTEGADMLGEDFDVSELFDLRVVISAPGRLVEHNGTEVRDGAVTWVITPTAEFIEDGDAVLRAVWEPDGSSGGSSGDVVNGLLALVAALAIAAVALGLVRRSRRRV